MIFGYAAVKMSLARQFSPGEAQSTNRAKVMAVSPFLMEIDNCSSQGFKIVFHLQFKGSSRISHPPPYCYHFILNKKLTQICSDIQEIYIAADINYN